MPIDPTIEAQVQATLTQLQSEQQIRVLLAVESGSRAWGFASSNSDYDVRFLYVHAPDWYVRIGQRRDVIERMLPNDLDVSGWELRKALLLMKRYNGALCEWLNSPIQYRLDPEFLTAARAAAMMYFRPAAALHHYASMAASAFAGLSVEPDSAQVSSKKLCYLLRALFCCRHIQRHGTQPSTAFLPLLEALHQSDEERAWIESVVAAKVAGSEKHQSTLTADRRRALAAEIDAAFADRATIGGRFMRAATKNLPPLLDDLLLRAVKQPQR